MLPCIIIVQIVDLVEEVLGARFSNEETTHSNITITRTVRHACTVEIERCIMDEVLVRIQQESNFIVVGHFFEDRCESNSNDREKESRSVLSLSRGYKDPIIGPVHQSTENIQLSIHRAIY